MVDKDSVKRLYEQTIGIANTMERLCFDRGDDAGVAYAAGLRAGAKKMAAWCDIAELLPGEGAAISCTEIGFIEGRHRGGK